MRNQKAQRGLSAREDCFKFMKRANLSRSLTVEKLIQVTVSMLDVYSRLVCTRGITNTYRFSEVFIDTVSPAERCDFSRHQT